MWDLAGAPSVVGRKTVHTGPAQHQPRRRLPPPRSPPCTRGRRLGENTSPSPSSRYPRARGADLTMMWMWSPPFPLPPRTRGRLPSDPGGHGGAPSTPAHAGPAATCSTRSSSTPLYPRARGASFTGRTNMTRTYPLPPRTRGQRPVVRAASSQVPSTPAHAGPARPRRAAPGGGSLYPRARGASTRVPLKYYGTRYRALRLPFTASPLAPSGTSHTPSRMTGPAAARSKTTVR